MSDSRHSLREPMFNAPFPVTVLVGAMLAAWGVQALVLGPAVESLILSRAALEAGRWHTLFSYQFLHAGFLHLTMNAVGAFAFGPPLVRLLGLRNRDVALFYVFFLLCGALAGAGQVVLSEGGVIGASGAVCGLWGGASRLLGRRGGLAPFLDRTVLMQALAFAIVNVLFGLFGPLLVGASIGWQAHIVGYVAGLLLIGVFGRLAGRLR